MERVEKPYLPAAGYDWMLPLYDPIVKLLGGESTRRILIEQGALPRDARVLDIGCGTGTLAVRIAQQYQGVQVTGIDPDPKALARARRKAGRAGVAVQLDRGFADALPYPDSSFDRVFSSFMLHHLPAGEKAGTLREVARVLKPGGSFHLVDFAKPEDSSTRGFVRWVHSHHRLDENTESRVLQLMREAGLANARVVKRGSLLMGRVAYYQAHREPEAGDR